MHATLTARKRATSANVMADVPAGVCLTEAGERAVLRRFRELGRSLTKAEVRQLVLPSGLRRQLRLRA